MMALGEELWVGLGNGQVLIFDVTRNDKFEDEGYVVLDEHKGEQQFLFVCFSHENRPSFAPVSAT